MHGLFDNGTTILSDAVGMLDDLQGAHRKADVSRRQALKVSMRVNGGSHESTAAAMANLGLCLFSQRRFRDSEIYFLRSLAIMRNRVGDGHYQTAGIIMSLYALQRVQGRIAREKLPPQFVQIIPKLPEAANQMMVRKFLFVSCFALKMLSESLKSRLPRE